MANTKEKRRRFNFIDVILLIVIIAILSVLAYIGFKAYNNYFHKDASGTPIRYEILIEGIDNDIKYFVSKGDTVTEIDTLTSIGKVIECKAEPSQYVGTDAEGNTVVSDHPTKSDVIITVEVNATGVGTTYDINGYTVCVGKEISFRTPGLSTNGECIWVEAVNE